MSDLVVCRPNEKRNPPVSESISGCIALITYEPPLSPLLQALFEDTIIPLAESSITKRSLGIFGKLIFTLFGKRFLQSPFKITKLSAIAEFLVFLKILFMK